MDDLHLRVQGRAGRITLNRPQALNALTYEQANRIEKQLLAWAEDTSIALVIIDATGERAFCAGGDIQDLYARGCAGDYAFGRQFWADEYRLNALIWNYPKPYVAIMHGFVMGGGVGISALGSHRIVTDSTQLAMPECSIGLIPDVGGTMLLGCAPGRLGEYLGSTGSRMGPADAILATFADHYVPQDQLEALTEALCEESTYAIERFAMPPPPGMLAEMQPQIDAHFAGETAMDIIRALEFTGSDWAAKTLKAMRRNSPLSVAATIEAIHRARAYDRIELALALEYRFSYRAMEDGEFLEGVRAAVIDKDRKPDWSPSQLEDLSQIRVARMLQPLGEHELDL